jgi:hypothetical protein
MIDMQAVRKVYSGAVQFEALKGIDMRPEPKLPWLCAGLLGAVVLLYIIFW